MKLITTRVSFNQLFFCFLFMGMLTRKKLFYMLAYLLCLKCPELFLCVLLHTLKMYYFQKNLTAASTVKTPVKTPTEGYGPISLLDMLVLAALVMQSRPSSSTLTVRFS